MLQHSVSVVTASWSPRFCQQESSPHRSAPTHARRPFPVNDTEAGYAATRNHWATVNVPGLVAIPPLVSKSNARSMASVSVFAHKAFLGALDFHGIQLKVLV